MIAILTAIAGAAAGALLMRAILRRRHAEQKTEIERDRQAFVGTLAAGLAHEMRNPLSTLRMHLELLKEDWASPVTERERAGHKRLEGILRETKRLEDTLADFLRFAVEHKFRREPVNLNALMRELAEFMAPRVEAQGLKLASETEPQLPTVEGDPGLLRHAVLNLVLNAVEASSPGGTITMRTARNGREVSIQVADQGAGIAPENLARIFEAYFSTKPSGTGLGLPTAKRIVDEHGGRVTVDSAPGRGSTFTVHLPTA
jgi:signal transduction histidine kinase